MEKRSQFTFYESIRSSIKRIKNKAARADAYDAICDYALYGIEPDLDKMPDVVAVLFLNVKPNLDASRKKAKNGKAGGSVKQTGSKPEASSKQPATEKEVEGEKEKEKEIENECYGDSVPAPGSMFTSFWSAYPTTSGGRDAAWQEWKTISPDVPTAQAILQSLETFKRCARWTQDDGRFIPSAAKFLRERQYEKPPVLSGSGTCYGASGRLGTAEMEAIKRVLDEDEIEAIHRMMEQDIEEDL